MLHCRKPQFPNYRYQILIAQIEDLNIDYVKIVSTYHAYFPMNNPSKSVKVGPGRFIVLNDSVSPEMFIKMYFNFSDFFSMVLQLLECRRGDSCMTVNRNFVHSQIVQKQEYNSLRGTAGVIFCRKGNQNCNKIKTKL